jgi:hypothetical protein
MKKIDVRIHPNCMAYVNYYDNCLKLQYNPPTPSCPLAVSPVTEVRIAVDLHYSPSYGEGRGCIENIDK